MDDIKTVDFGDLFDPDNLFSIFQASNESFETLEDIDLNQLFDEMGEEKEVKTAISSNIPTIDNDSSAERPLSAPPTPISQENGQYSDLHQGFPQNETVNTTPAPPIKAKSAYHQRQQPTFVDVTESDKSDFVQTMRNKNTVKKTESVMNMFRMWLGKEPRYEMRNIETMDPCQLDNHIGSFLLSIRKGDGTEYEPDTLTSYHKGIDRYLREAGYCHSIVTDREFLTSRTILSSKRKELKQKGKGNRPNAAEPLTTGEEHVLRETKCVGCESPKQLQNQKWLNNTMLFGLRGGKENHNLRWGDIALKEDEQGNEYLEYSERETKTRTGEGTHQRAFHPKQYAHVNDTSNCPVRAYKQFASHRPAQMCTPESPFYLAINSNRRRESVMWYWNMPLGENTLRSIMKNMAKQANLPGKKTNHSARKTTCTKLLHAGVAPTTIQQLTGHKNIQSVNNYATASNNMQQQMSNILSDGANGNVMMSDNP